MIKVSKDLIKILPFGQEFKNKLLGEYDTFGPDLKYTIDDALWDAYDALYKLRLDENMRLALERAKEGKETLDEGLYKRVREQTERELQTQEATMSTHIDLDETRKKLQELLAFQQKS
jgi:hypothetical protein